MINYFIKYLIKFNYRITRVGDEYRISKIKDNGSVEWCRHLKTTSSGLELSDTFIYGDLCVIYERIRFKGIINFNLIKERIDNSIDILHKNERLIKYYELISKVISSIEIETTVNPNGEDSIYFFKVINEGKITIGIQLKVESDDTISAGVRCEVSDVGDITEWLDFIRRMPFPVGDDRFGGLTGGVYIYNYNKETLKDFYSDINDYLVKRVIPVVDKFK